MFKSILVPLDGSTFAEHALPLAVAIARPAGATLRLVRVLQEVAGQRAGAAAPGGNLETDLQKDLRAAALAYLEQTGRRLQASGVPVEIDLIPQVTNVTETIRADVAARPVDLVVLTSHGRGAVSRLWLGSVADELVRSLTVPLLLIRPSENVELDLTVDAKLSRLVLALDGRSNADGILQPALTLGQLMGAEFILMHVLPPPVAVEYTAFMSSPDCTSLAPSMEIIEAAELQRTNARQYLERVADRIRTQGSPVQILLRTGEQPATAILAEAESAADLIALETHGRSGLSRLIMGSTHPVLVCRGPEPEAGPI